MLVYLSQCVRVQGPGAVGVTKAMLPTAGAPDGRIFWSPQRIVSAHRHGDGGSRATTALRAIQGWGQALTPSQQQLPGTEVTRHRWRATLHHPAVTVAVTVVGAAEGAAKQTIGPLPPVAVNRK